MSGSTTQVTQTAHWTAIIATIALAVCMTIGIAALGYVVIRDGNTAEVTTAIDGLIKILIGFALTFGSVVGGPQVVSVLLGRFAAGSSGATAGATSATPAAPTPPAAS